MARICIDPGHGPGENVGLNGYREGTSMWYFANFLVAALIARGHDAFTTRPNLTDKPELSARGAMAKGCDLFYSPHTNASGNPDVKGASVYDSVADGVDILEAALVKVIADTVGTFNQGVRHRESGVTPGTDYYGVLRSAVLVGCPDAMLVEHGYHTNPADCAWLSDHKNLNLLADRVADTITAYYGGSATIPTQEGTMAKIGIVSVTTRLNVRSAASATAADIGDLANGAQVLVLATENGWCKIQWGSTVAYVAAQYVSLIDPASPVDALALQQAQSTIADLQGKLMANEGALSKAMTDIGGLRMTCDESSALLNGLDNAVTILFGFYQKRHGGTA